VSLQLAVKIAKSNSDYDRWPFGCVIKKGGAIQAVGWNILKSDPRYTDNHLNCSVHAEEHALKQMRNGASGCVLYVARMLRTGNVGLAKPCIHCQKLIRDAGVKRVIFSIDNDMHGIWKP
jgi:pyrimidine deaminase RibD-like protein